MAIFTKRCRSPAAGRAWSETTWLSADVPGWTMFELSQGIHQPRYLSDSGRLFFNSREALVPAGCQRQVGCV